MKKILTILVFSLAVLAFDCSKTKPSFPPTDNGGPMPDNSGAVYSTNIILDDWKRQPTAKGLQVQAYSDPSPSVRNLVDAGVQRTIDIASKQYSNTPTHLGYIAEFFNVSRYCDGVTTTSVPAFIIWSRGMANANLDQTEWDKDSRVGIVGLCAAGAFHLTNGVPTITVTNDERIAFNAAQYEWEHLALFITDPERFITTQFHYEGQGHPILSDGEGMASKTVNVNQKFATYKFSDGSVQEITASNFKSESTKLALNEWKKGLRACLILTK